MMTSTAVKTVHATIRTPLINIMNRHMRKAPKAQGRKKFEPGQNTAGKREMFKHDNL